MAFYLAKTPELIQSFFPKLIWRMPTSEKIIYLSFDDGPIPETTPWILDQLKLFNAKASFFCVGENVKKYPILFNRIKEEGHLVGNHSYNHLSGWNTDDKRYFHNIRHCENLTQTGYFRPPYGRLRLRQIQFLKKHFKIVMWDVLSGDFDHSISREQCLENVINNAQNGSIVVFHDNIKAKDKLEYTLPKVLRHFSQLDYRFRSIHD